MAFAEWALQGCPITLSYFYQVASAKPKTDSGPPVKIAANRDAGCGDRGAADETGGKVVLPMGKIVDLDSYRAERERRLREQQEERQRRKESENQDEATGETDPAKDEPV